MSGGGWVALLAGAGLALYLLVDENGVKVELKQMEQPLKVEQVSVPIQMPPPPQFSPIQPIKKSSKPAEKRLERAVVEKAIELLKVEPLKVEPLKVEERRAEVTLAQQQREVEDRANGRVKLKVMELGKGPLIEIAWPPQQQAQSHLQRWMEQCADMEIALINGAGDLFIDTGERGKRWELNLDRYSGFVREVGRNSRIVDATKVASIRSKHGAAVQGAAPVAVFSRKVDAQLLGGIGRIVGSRYMDSRKITARYVMKQGTPVVTALQVDGESVSGEIELRVRNRKGCI